MVGEGLDLQAGDAAVLVGAELDVDVVVAGERVGLQVLGAVLDPLDGLPDGERGDDREDIARIDRHLAAEAATDVVRLDPDVLLRQAAHEREHRPNGVRRLARHVQRHLAADGVPVRDAAAGLDRRDVDARDVDVLGDAHLGLGDRGVRPGPIARFPVPDVVVGLVGAAVGPQHERIRLQRLEGIDDDRQRLVVDVDRRDAVGGDVLGRRHDRGDFLGLVHDGRRRQHHLLVAREGRHPVEPGLLEVGARDHGQDARDLERLGRIDALDRRVGVGAANDVQPELAGQVDVVDVLAHAADEARVLLALDGMAHAADLGGGVGLCLVVIVATPRSGRGRFGRDCLSFGGLSGHDRGALARAERARRLLDGLDDVHVAGAATEVAADALPDLVLRRIGVLPEQPGRLHDHARRAEAALEAVLVPEGLLEWMEVRAPRHPLDGLDAAPVGLDREHRARLGALAVDVDRAGAAVARVAADVRAGQPEVVAQQVDEQEARLDVRLVDLAVDGDLDVLGGHRELLAAYAPARATARAERPDGELATMASL